MTLNVPVAASTVGLMRCDVAGNARAGERVDRDAQLPDRRCRRANSRSGTCTSAMSGSRSVTRNVRSLTLIVLPTLMWRAETTPANGARISRVAEIQLRQVVGGFSAVEFVADVLDAPADTTSLAVEQLHWRLIFALELAQVRLGSAATSKRRRSPSSRAST